MPVRRSTPEEVDEANRIRGEGWTISPVPRRPSKTSPGSSTGTFRPSTSKQNSGSPDEN